MADLGWVKFFIPRLSFGTHDRHPRLNPTADLYIHRGLHKHTVSRTLPESSKISHERIPFSYEKRKKNLNWHRATLWVTEHVRNNQIVLYVENPRTLLFQFLVKYIRNEVITLPCRGTQELTPPIQWYSGTHLSGPLEAPPPALTLLASRFQLLHVSWTMWT